MAHKTETLKQTKEQKREKRTQTKEKNAIERGEEKNEQVFTFRSRCA